jgi:hypothetical protein
MTNMMATLVLYAFTSVVAAAQHSLLRPLAIHIGAILSDSLLMI